MSNIKKIVLHSCIFIATVLVNLFFCVGCAEAAEEDKKYDVAIKVANNYGQEWIFTPDIDELHYEFEYTGEEMTFGVESYNLPDHPEWGDQWIRASGEGANVFDLRLAYADLEGNTGVDFVLEKGLYCLSVQASSTSDLWNFRSVDLYITVK